MVYSKLLLCTTGLAWIATAIAMPMETLANNVQTERALGEKTLLPQREQQPIAQEQKQTPSYTPPPNRGTPPANKTTGSRGNCFHHSARPPLATLVGQSHLSWTMSDRPTIWIYSPYPAAETLQAELIVQTEASDQELYRGTFSLSSMPGVQGIRLPASIELEVGKVYRWYVDLLCQDANGALDGLAASANPATLTGLIERVTVSAELRERLKTLSGNDAIALYGQNHLWYDMLTALAQQRLEKPSDPSLQQLWQTLLQDEANVGLAFLSEEPLIGEVILTP